MSETVNEDALDQLFRTARTHGVWWDRPVPEDLLRRIYDLTRWGPTSANCFPARFLFLTTPEQKEKLRPHLMAANVEQTMAAPVIVIIAYDLKFYELLPRLFPHVPEAKSWFDGDPAVARETAFRNSTLQGAYLIFAARALGLDCGPMSGFDNAAVDAEFFPDGQFKSNFICNLGYGDSDALIPRSPRPDFGEVCRII